VGAPDPDARTSQIVEDTDYDYDVLGQEIPETAECYFNNQTFRDGDFVCSGSELLQCKNGAWIREGSCDPDNP
jgi:hypothetical protein